VGATGINLCGRLSGGATFNGHDSIYNGTLSFNDRGNEAQLNQFYLVAERAVDKTSDGFDFGARADVNYGTDSSFTTALGWDDEVSKSHTLCKMAIPQAYVEAFIPVGSGLTIKAGHFYTLIGYEVVTAPETSSILMPTPCSTVSLLLIRGFSRHTHSVSRLP
jgi:Putative beta-barrel porin-2, OmpL-like. bbp2